MLHRPASSQRNNNHTAGGGAATVSTIDPNVPTSKLHSMIVSGGNSPKPFMWARPASTAGGERPLSRNTDAPEFTHPDGTRLPRPPPSAAFGSRPMARQKPMSMSLDLFDLQSRLNTPNATGANANGSNASRGAPRRLHSSSGGGGRVGLAAAADEFEMPAPQQRSTAAPIPIIVEDSWGDMALPPVHRTVVMTSGRRSKPQPASLQQPPALPAQQQQHSATGSPMHAGNNAPVQHQARR